MFVGKVYIRLTTHMRKKCRKIAGCCIRALTFKGWCEMHRCRKVLNIGGWRGRGGGARFRIYVH